MPETSEIRLSVLMPNYNYGKFIGEALASTAQFNSKRTEIVIQDALSKDNSAAVVDSYSSSLGNVRWSSERDSGQSDALNKALDRSTGTWIGWLNSDEFYLPEVEQAIDFSSISPNIDLIYGDCYFVDATGSILRLRPAHQFDARVLRTYGCYIPSCATFIRRSALEKVGWDTSFRRAMDWDLYLELMKRGKFQYVPRPIAAFRVHGDQVTNVPESEDVSEFQELARKHDMSEPPFLGYRLRYNLGKGLHGAHKLISGGYNRQLKVRRNIRGNDIRWWSGAAQAEAANRAINY